MDEKRLVIRYNPGQYSFPRLNQSANDGQILDLAEAINGFQEDEAEQILTVTTKMFP